MARIRTIKPSLFRHADLFDAERETGLPLRVAYPGLWTACDREGRFAWKPRELKLDVLPFDDVDFSHVLDALLARGFIVKYSVGGREYGFVPTFTKHQVVNNRESPSTLPPPPEPRQQADESITSTRVPRVVDASGTPLVHAQGEREEELEGEGDTATSNEVARARRPDEPQLTLVEGGQEKPWVPPPCPHLEVLALWAEILPALPQHEPSQWKGSRADHLRARWRETAEDKRWPDQAAGLTFFRRFFTYVGYSAFLCGRAKTSGDKRPFIVELEWLVKPGNWAKAIEGKYHSEVEESPHHAGTAVKAAAA